MTKTCTRCGIEKDGSCFPLRKEMKDGLSSWCRSCGMIVTKKWAQSEKGREKHLINHRNSRKMYDKRHPEKRRAHYALKNAIRTGKIIKQVCQVCSDPLVDGHHYDYTKPLEVIWLCRKHHFELHNK